MSLVLAVDPTGVDVSPYKLPFTRMGNTILGGREMTFDGTGDYLLNSTANWRSTDSQGAIEAWVRRSVAGANHCILSSADDATFNSYLYLYIDSANKLSVGYRSNAGTLDLVPGSSVLVAGQWWHTVLESSGSSWYMYVNGVLQTLTPAFGSNTGNWFGDIIAGRDNVCVGALKWSGGPTYYLNGNIAGVWVYSTPMSAAWWKYRYITMRQHLMAA